MSHTWTRNEWVKWWGSGDAELRDFLWAVMVDTWRREVGEK